MRENRYIRVVMTAIAALLLASAAFGQMQIKVNDNVNLKFGILLQTQGDATEDVATRIYAQNVFIRRARILLGGQIAPNLTFFAETDSPNLFKSTAPGSKKLYCRRTVERSSRLRASRIPWKTPARYSSFLLAR